MCPRDCIHAGIRQFHNLEALLLYSRNTADRKLHPPSHNFLTTAPCPLEVHVAPLAIIEPSITSSHLDATRAHIHDQVKKSIQQLYGKEVGPGLPVGLCSLQAAMTEQQQATGFCGAEVKRYGTCLLCVPPGQCQVGRRCVEGDRLQGLHTLTAERQITMDTDLRVSLFS